MRRGFRYASHGDHSRMGTPRRETGHQALSRLMLSLSHSAVLSPLSDQSSREHRLWHLVRRALPKTSGIRAKQLHRLHMVTVPCCLDGPAALQRGLIGSVVAAVHPSSDAATGPEGSNRCPVNAVRATTSHDVFSLFLLPKPFASVGKLYFFPHPLNDNQPIICCGWPP